jgi:WD40 repeat protein
MTKVALLIGVSLSQQPKTRVDSFLEPLPTACHDVRAIAEILERQDLGGFEPKNVQQLLDPDLQEIRVGIEWLLRDRQPEDLVLLYFSGHAIADREGKLYFTTRNTDVAELSSTAVPADFLQALLYTSPAQQQAIVLDCCYTELGESARDSPRDRLDLKQQLGGYGKAVLTASTHFEADDRFCADLAIDREAIRRFRYGGKVRESGCSPYTYYLIEGIETGGANRDGDGQISLGELHDYIANKMQIFTPANPPAFYALSEETNIVLSQAPIPTPELTYREAVENFVRRRGGQIGRLGWRSLEINRENCGIKSEIAQKIRKKVLIPYQERQEKLDRYREALQGAIAREKRSLKRETDEKLHYFYQDILALTEVEVAAIEAKLKGTDGDRDFPLFLLTEGAIVVATIAGIIWLWGYISKPTASPVDLPPYLSFLEHLDSIFPAWDFTKDSPPRATATSDPSPSPSSPDGTAPRSPLPPAFTGTPVPFTIPTAEPQTLTGHDAPVQGLAIAPRSSLLVSGGWNNQILLWDLKTGKQLDTLTAHEDIVRDIAVNPDGKSFASASDDGTIYIWNLKGRMVSNTLSPRGGSIYAIAYSPDGQTLASGSEDGRIRLWNARTGALEQTLEGHRDRVRALAYTPDGQTLVSGSGDATIKLWDVATGEVRQTLTGHTRLVRAIAITPDGKTLVSGSWDETIKIWDLDRGELQNTLRGHTDLVTVVTVTPDGQTLLSGSDDNTIKIWDLDSGDLKGTLTDHVSDIFAIQMTPDGTTMVSASWDQTIKIWR